MNDFNNQWFDDDKNFSGDGSDDTPQTPGEAHSDNISGALDALIKDVDSVGDIKAPMGLIPPKVRNKICDLCPKMVEDKVAELDINELDEWNSINVESDRLGAEAKKIFNNLNRISARRAVFCGSLELKYDVAGERLMIDGGKLIRKRCGKAEKGDCDLNE